MQQFLYGFIHYHDTWIDMVNGNVYIRVWALSCVSLGSIPTDQWSNIVMTLSYNGVELNYSGYINGVYKNSGYGTRSVPGGSASMYYPISANDSTNCGNGNRFNGLVSNYQFYSTALTNSQITALYERGLDGEPFLNDLVLWLPLQGNTYNYINNGYTASSYGAYFVNNPSPIGYSGSLNEPISIWQLIYK